MDYDPYVVFIRDDFVEIVEYEKSEYDNLCKPCRAHLHPRQAFTGASDVTPKEEVS